MMTSKQEVIGYWVTTGLLAAAFLAAGAAELASVPSSRTWKSDSTLPDGAEAVVSPDDLAAQAQRVNA
jgi:hypothetical protein